MNAVQEIFHMQNTGLLLQNIYRKVQNLGLQEKYLTDSIFSLLMQMIPALAFAPVSEVVNVFEELQEEMSEERLPVLDYFEDTYIGRKRRRNHADPMFPHEVWSVHSRTTNKLPRTNNNVEGWNRKMHAAIACHSNLWRFITILKRECGLNNTIFDQALGDHAVPSPRKKYRNTIHIFTYINIYIY